MTSKINLQPGPVHLNPFGCVIKVSEETGRGVYASRFIPRNTLIEVSPVLLFTKKEYDEHGKHTVLDHYTFNWSDGRMALALGLGSLFNHSEQPNVSFKLDSSTGSIQYSTVRDIEPDQELCIFYGHQLWFDPAGSESSKAAHSPSPVRDDGWGGLAALDEATLSAPSTLSIRNPFAEGDPDAIVPEEELPFTRFKLPPEEEEPGSIRTIQAWVVDIPDQRHITTLLKWLKHTGLDGPELGHLKRVRKAGSESSMLLSPHPDAPILPSDLNLPEPYQLPVPSSSALTLPSLALKSALWPTTYTPRRKDEVEPWTRDRLRWAWDAMKAAVDKAVLAKEVNDLPVASHIPAPYDLSPGSDLLAFSATDTRQSLQHPLKHGAINTIRQLADYHASLESTKSKRIAAATSTLPSTSSPSPSNVTPPATSEARNGTNYLLTDKAFFTTHEPCIMCSMALLHSRVKDVFYLYPMPKTGGCGGCACLPTLKGVNHRFNIFQWKLDRESAQFTELDISLDDNMDA